MPLMDTFMKIINIHVITGRFSPAVPPGTTIIFLNFIPCCHQQLVNVGFQMARMGGGEAVHHYVPS